MNRIFHALPAAVASVSLLVVSGESYAQKSKTTPADVAKLDVKEATLALASTDPSRIESALVNIRLAGKEGGGRSLTMAVVKRLQSGLPKELARKALDTLGDLEDPAATEAGEAFLSHRDAEVRVSAVRCLGGAKSPAAQKALRHALGDLDPRVHSAAATVLGTTKATDALPDLVMALDKGVMAAAVSIGMLCDAKSCDSLTDRLKVKPVDVIASGLQQILARGSVADDVKKKAIAAVRALETRKAREFLTEIKAAWPPTGSKPVLEALNKAIADLEGAGK